MAVPRISLAWLLVLALLGIAGFFAYQIYVTAGSGDLTEGSNGAGVGAVVPHNDHVEARDPVMPAFQAAAPIVPMRVIQATPALEMPAVVGQTEEDLRATRPVSETPPTVQYADPEPQDPMEGPVSSEAEFGDNLRHPEQMVEMAPPMGSMRMDTSGLGAKKAALSGGANYSPELAQNGGEFMSGIMAFDGADSGGISYSMI